MKLRPSEHLEQVRFIAWWRKNYPEDRIFAIPNGGYRTKIEASKLKAEGVLKGVHDLYIRKHQLWIEMKRDKAGRLSKEQKDWGAYVESLGDTWIAGYGFEDTKEKVIKFLEEKK